MRPSRTVIYAGFEEKKLDDEYAISAEKTRTDNLIIAPHKNMVRMMLKLLAYEEKAQKELLPTYWEIEHIFPQTWDSKFYTFDKEEANEKLEHIGNKLPLEKKLNISASNNYFIRKKEKYKQSQISISKKLGSSALEEWNLDNITSNDIKICSQVKNLFKQWVEDYISIDNPKPTQELTEEQLEMIETLRNQGVNISIN